MKTHQIEFGQHLSHWVHDEEEAGKYIEEAISMIGIIVVYFNALEASLDFIICENFTDRTDITGLSVLDKMAYSAKVDLFKRFCDTFQSYTDNVLEDYDSTINNLRECGRLRNMVVHANWSETNENGFAFVRLKIARSKISQEYAQFNYESLVKIEELILTTQTQINDLWEHSNELLYDRK